MIMIVNPASGERPLAQQGAVFNVGYVVKELLSREAVVINGDLRVASVEEAVPRLDERVHLELEAVKAGEALPRPLEEGGDESAYRFLELQAPSPPPALEEIPAGLLPVLGRRAAQRPWLLAGNRARVAGKSARADYFLAVAQRLDPTDPLAARLTGLTARRLRSWRRRASAGDAAASLRLAAARLVLGRPRLSLKWSEPLLARRPDARAALLAGWARLALGQPGRARRLLEQAMGAGPELQKRARAGLVIACLPGGVGKWLALLTSAAL